MGRLPAQDLPPGRADQDEEQDESRQGEASPHTSEDF